MMDVNPVPQFEGTSTFVQDPKQLQMETTQTPYKQLCDSSDNGLHSYPHIATFRNLQENLAIVFEKEPAAQGSDGHTYSSLLPIGNIPGSTPNIISHRCRFLIFH